jgi:hypothetical protein
MPGEEKHVTRFGNILPIGSLFEYYLDKADPKWVHFGLLFTKANLLHFHKNNQFQNMVSCKFI